MGKRITCVFAFGLDRIVPALVAFGVGILLIRSSLFVEGLWVLGGALICVSVVALAALFSPVSRSEDSPAMEAADE